MKIISLQFKNIHSLSGEHTVSFDKPPLQGAGLILITGPTGAGKSTLLDVISLALFNKIPRLPDISKSAVGELNSIMTHHSKEAWAAVTYESKGHRYISKWSIEVNRNGNLNDYHMEIWHENSQQIMDLKKSEVPQKNAELIGLNYPQFIKSIVLSQGEFAQFLKAKHEDRAELLEKITGTDIYRTLGKKAFEKHKETKQQYTALQELIQQLPNTSAEDLIQMQETVLTIDQELSTLHEKTQKLIAVVHQFDQWQKKKLAIEDATQRLANWKTKDQQIKIDKTKLSQHESLLSIGGELSLIKAAQEESLQLEAEQKDLGAKVSLSAQKRNQLETHLANQLNAAWDKDTIKEKLLVLKQEMHRLDAEIQRLRSLGDQLRNQSNELISKLPSHLKQWHEEKIAPGLALKALKLIRQEATSNMNSKEQDIGSLREKLQEDQNNKTKLQELKFWLSKTKELEDENKHLGLQIAEEEKKGTTLKSGIKMLHEKINELQSKVKQLRLDKETRLSQVNLNEWRSRLESGQPCPLCGSLSHPYCDQQLTFDIGNLEIELHQKELEQKKAEQQLQINLTESSACQTKIQLLRQQSDKLDEEQRAVSITIEKLWTERLDITTLDQKINQLEVEMQINTKAVQAYETLLQISPLEQMFADLDATLSTYLVLNKERQEQLPSSEQWDQLQNAYDQVIQCSIEEDRLMEKTTAIKDRLENKKTETNKLLAKITPRLRELNLIDHEAALESMMDQGEYEKTKEAITLHEKEGDNLLHTLSLLNQELTILQSAIPDQGDAHTYQTELETHKRMMTALSEKRGGIQEKIKQWHQHKQQAEKLEDQQKKIGQELYQYEMLNQLIGDSMGKQYANFAQELTMQHIILLANKRLAALTDRYLLVSPVQDGKVDLFVRDLYLGGMERSVKTLSGGETFILSLALALSLSDLASKNVKLDCLFIDEGFGTLDGDTLDTVISTLERLQEEGDKTIAIISHVDSLKERINSQIRLIRDSSGLSRLQII